ncbi:SH3-like domain-containing protein [Lactobacillus kalixensis]|uniref:SH3-like domain-containing protein n=1 Tax=Lactobacillus kalixensis TaxID=227944 RepID=UPI00070E061D|nr:SH3-like domain-containing protein [Lactobacillus kalixensis]
MNKKFRITLLASAILISVSFANKANTKTVYAKSYPVAVTKIAGNGNYGIFNQVTRSGPSQRITSTRFFKHGTIQSDASFRTHKGKYWDIFVDGRRVGWVNQKFFKRSKISVAKNISVERNPSYSMPTRDAINYATDKEGTAVLPSKVHVSQSAVSTRSAYVTYRYGKAVAHAQFTVYRKTNGHVTKKPKRGSKAVKGWKGSSIKSSKNWNSAHGFTPETQSNTFKAGDLTLKTRLFQPRFVSIGDHIPSKWIGRVGVIPEGITLHHNKFVTSILPSADSLHGHLVMYNLNVIKSKTAAQNLRKLDWDTFKHYAKNIRVSPYIKIGHGQSLGSTGKYIYVMADNNKYLNGNRSEEILRVKKSNMLIDKIWTFRISPHHYIHNATFVNGKTMYALFHSLTHDKYEYWKLSLKKGVWRAKELGATKGVLVENSPVQAFTYSNGKYYVGFNDNIFKVAKNGRVLKHYHFHIGREIEGLSVKGSTIYVELAKRSELVHGKL